MEEILPCKEASDRVIPQGFDTITSVSAAADEPYFKSGSQGGSDSALGYGSAFNQLGRAHVFMHYQRGVNEESVLFQTLE